MRNVIECHPHTRKKRERCGGIPGNPTGLPLPLPSLTASFDTPTKLHLRSEREAPPHPRVFGEFHPAFTYMFMHSGGKRSVHAEFRTSWRCERQMRWQSYRKLSCLVPRQLSLLTQHSRRVAWGLSDTCLFLSWWQSGNRRMFINQHLRARCNGQSTGCLCKLRKKKKKMCSASGSLATACTASTSDATRKSRKCLPATRAASRPLAGSNTSAPIGSDYLKFLLFR